MTKAAATTARAAAAGRAGAADQRAGALRAPTPGMGAVPAAALSDLSQPGVPCSRSDRPIQFSRARLQKLLPPDLYRLAHPERLLQHPDIPSSRTHRDS